MRDAELIGRDIEAYLARQERKEILRFLTAGSVDDGKSTLIGRLLHDSNMVYEDQLAALRRDSAKGSAGDGEIDYSYLVDGLLSEREQGITIDVAYRYFATDRRKFIIADTPGHEQYTRNMATGASTADLAIILVDARHGVLPQTRRHTTIAALLGIRHFVLAVNKMDVVGYEQAVFDAIRREYAAFAEKLGIRDVHGLPLSAREGDNVVQKSERMPWYGGPPLLTHLETVPIASDKKLDVLRFPVQYVLRPNLDFRGFSGTIASGILRRGDRIMALPSGRTSHVERIVTYDGDLEEAFPPMAVTVTLADEIDISRGDVLVHEDKLPSVARSIEAMVVWMNERPMQLRGAYLLKHGTKVVSAEVHAIHDRLDVTTLERLPTRELLLNDIGSVTLTANRPLFFDAYTQNRAMGAFILIDRLTNATVGAGMITGPSGAEPSAPEEVKTARASGAGRVTLAERMLRLGQKPAAVFLIGGAADRQEELAYTLERKLWDDGYTSHVLEPQTIGSAKLCIGLGLITIAVTTDSVELSALRAAFDPEHLLVVDCREGSESASVEAILRLLRDRNIIG
jgi:bifunctional enzyme CysN/CysC